MAKQQLKEHINGPDMWKLEWDDVERYYELFYWYLDPPGPPEWLSYRIYRSHLVSLLGFWWNKHKTGSQAHNE